MHVKDADSPDIYIREANKARGTLRINRFVLIVAILLVIAVCSGAGLAWWFSHQSVQGDTGTYFIPKGSMSDEEAQNFVNKMAEQSRITISLAPQMSLRNDGSLRMNFVVVEPNNGLSERLELEQDGTCVYRSGVVDPGHRIEWGHAEAVHAGSATATIFAVSDGVDSGSPVSVEVEIVDES